MKKTLALLFIAFLSLNIHAQQNPTQTTQDPNAPVFQFVNDVIDYGTINVNSDGLRVFKFKNIGKSPLIIEKVLSSCGCTVPKKPEAPIMPGEEGQIQVQYATNRVGGFSKSITIYSNASEPTKVVRIKGIVVTPESPVETKKSTVSN